MHQARHVQNILLFIGFQQTSDMVAASQVTKGRAGKTVSKHLQQCQLDPHHGNLSLVWLGSNPGMQEQVLSKHTTPFQNTFTHQHTDRHTCSLFIHIHTHTHTPVIDFRFRFFVPPVKPAHHLSSYLCDVLWSAPWSNSFGNCCSVKSYLID